MLKAPVSAGPIHLVSLDELAARHVPDSGDRLAYGPQAQNFGELWLPSGDGPFPIVILIHGGCWRNDLPGLELVRPLAQALRARGAAVWNIEYRRLGDECAGYPGTFQDVAAAADHVRVLAQRHPLELKRCVALGHSAGGHLALWLAARHRIPACSVLQCPDPLQLTHAISVGGLGDLKAMQDYSAAAVCGVDTIPKLIDIANRGERAYEDTSPASLLPFGVPMTLMVGVFDSALPPFFDQRFGDMAVARGDRAEVRVLPDAGHLDVIAPWTEAGSRVVEAAMTSFNIDDALRIPQ